MRAVAFGFCGRCGWPSPGPASGQGCAKSSSARSSTAPGLSSATKCEAPSTYFSFWSSAWSSKPWRISGRMLGSSAPARTRFGVLSRVAPVGTCQDADGLGLDEVAVEGGARSCSGRFAELGDENLDVFCGEGLPVRREAGQHVARHPLVALAHQQGTEERHGGQQVEPGAPDDREHQLGAESEVRGRDAERQVALDPARVPQAKLVANE